LLKRPGGRFVVSLPAVTPDGLCQVVEHEDAQFGYFVFPALTRPYTELERTRLAMLAAFLGRLMQRRAEADKRARSLDQIEAKLEQQAQILNQMHESVITMDPAGFITSWNRGAEQLFGYSALEAIGRNVLFLYENEEEGFAARPVPGAGWPRDGGASPQEVRRGVLGQPVVVGHA
jgi:PAS domain-containing protein